MERFITRYPQRHSAGAPPFYFEMLTGEAPALRAVTKRDNLETIALTRHTGTSLQR